MTQNHASEAADKIYAGYLRRANSCEPGATAIVQAAIDAATADLLADHTKLMGVVQGYITAPGQIRGEAYRDLVGTFDWINGKRKLDELGGWAMCYEREKQRVAEKDAEIATLRAKLANAIPMPITAGGPTV